MIGREAFPERRGKDHLRNAIEAGVASVPVLGGAGAELLNFYLPAAMEQRRERWFKMLDERLAEVEDQVLDDEAFQTIVLRATKAAFGTHLDEKLRLLANAVRSAADIVGRGDDDFMATRLLGWVDELEPLHFRILGAIRNDHGWGGQVQWRDVLDRIPVEDDVWYEALEDLTSRRLVGTTGYNADRPVAEYKADLVWVMKRGAQLVQFVHLMVDDE
jgi:hypothetical protein